MPEKKRKRFSRASARDDDLADDLDDVVEVIERDLVAEQDVLAIARLAQQEGGAAADDIDAVVDEGADGVRQRQLLAAGR